MKFRESDIVSAMTFKKIYIANISLPPSMLFMKLRIWSFKGKERWLEKSAPLVKENVEIKQNVKKRKVKCNLGSTQVKNKGALKMLTRIETLTLFNK